MKSNWIIGLSLAGNALAILVAMYGVQRMGGMRSVWLKLTKPEIISVQAQRKSVFDMLEIDSTNIVMLGNSLTAYGEWSELLDNPKVLNRGIPGETIAGIKQRFPKILDQHPKQVFLMIGINDLMYHDADRVINEYEHLLESIMQEYPGAPITLQEILPITDAIQTVPTNNNDIQKVNKALAALAEKYKLKLLPLYEFFADDSNQLKAVYSHDGVHLTGQAYLVWKNELEKFINESPY
ncbi:MAG: hypothetical protein KDC24_03135 [Saprospiraceae bacterium]|nr:hypothetical protein [Saprospiraceae bacterium]